MIAFSSLLAEAAHSAGIPLPPNPDDFKADEFPYFHLFCAAQLGKAMPSPGCHWDNAKIIAAIPAEKIKTIDWKELLALGFQIGEAS